MPLSSQLISDVRIALSSCCDGKDLPALAQALAVQGYHVQLRTALGGGDGADCLRNLRHAFITVTLPNLPSTASMTRIGSSLNLRSCEQQQPTQQQQSSRGASRRFIIDPQFKEQFVIAKATARYCSIIAAVPTVLVAPEDHLPLLVHFLCTEMSLAFRQLGAVLPPWRQASSLLTKWKPRKSTSSEEGLVLPRSAYDQQQQQHEPLNFGLGSAHMGDSVALSLCHMLHPQQPPFGSLVFGGGGIAGAAGMGMSMDRSASTKSSFEPLRVYLGGNFNPINPQPTTALA